MEIDRFSGTPAYRQVADWLRELIRSGEIPPGGQVPSKARVRAQLGVSGLTYDRAIAILRAEGLVHTARGLGHFAVDPLPPP